MYCLGGGWGGGGKRWVGLESDLVMLLSPLRVRGVMSPSTKGHAACLPAGEWGPVATRRGESLARQRQKPPPRTCGRTFVHALKQCLCPCDVVVLAQPTDDMHRLEWLGVGGQAFEVR